MRFQGIQENTKTLSRTLSFSLIQCLQFVGIGNGIARSTNKATMKLSLISAAAACLLGGGGVVHSFRAVPPATARTRALLSTTATEEVAAAATEDKLLSRDRYVATNRESMR